MTVLPKSNIQSQNATKIIEKIFNMVLNKECLQNVEQKNEIVYEQQILIQ